MAERIACNEFALEKDRGDAEEEMSGRGFRAGHQFHGDLLEIVIDRLNGNFTGVGFFRAVTGG